MKQQASPTVRRVLIVLNNWAFGSVTATDCLSALEHAVTDCLRMARRADIMPSATV